MKRRFRLEFNKDKCKGCELCISVCPKKILTLDGVVNAKGYRPAGVANQAECIGCQSCAMMCPDLCITILELEEGESA